MPIGQLSDHPHLDKQLPPLLRDLYSYLSCEHTERQRQRQLQRWRLDWRLGMEGGGVDFEAWVAADAATAADATARCAHTLTLCNFHGKTFFFQYFSFSVRVNTI